MTLLLAAPWLAFAVLALVPGLRRQRHAVRATVWLVAAALATGAVLVWRGDAVTITLGRWLGSTFPLAVDVTFSADALARAMGATVGLVAAAILVYASAYMQDEPAADYGRFFTVVFMFIGAMIAAVFSVQLLPFYAFWELMGLASYLLIGFYRDRPSARRAAVRAFWVTRFGDVGFLIGVIVAAWSLPTLNFADWARDGVQVPAATREAVLLLLFLGVAGKSAQFPLHVWLPDAMEGPTPVSALVHAATMVAAGVFLLLRVQPLLAMTPVVADLVLAIGVGTALLGAAQACAQRDLKQVLAMSTISQLGYMVAAAGALAAPAALYHLLTHAFFKALLFLTAGVVAHSLGSLDLRRLGGLWRGDRIAAVALLVGGAALSGVPPLSGGLSKELLVGGVFHRSPVAGALLLMGSALTALYVGRVWAVVLPAQQGSPADAGAAAAHDAHAAAWPMQAALLALTAATVFLGVAQSGILAAVAGHAAHPPVWLQAGEVALAALGLAAGWRWGRGTGRDPGGAWADAARAGLGMPWLHDGAYRRLLLPLGRALGWFDRYVVDGLVNAVAAATWSMTAPLRRADGGSLSLVLAGIWLGWLGMWWWLR